MNLSDAATHGNASFADANGIKICYESFGDPAAPPIVLIMGLAAQMVVWDDDFCELLASKGYRVIRFDNRDMGLSSHYAGDVPTPTIMEIFGGGTDLRFPYTLRDNASDTIGLMDALGIDKAHVVGLSMGGMIAQEIAINFPERVKTLTSIMSTTGDPSLPQPTPAAMAVLTRVPPEDKAGYVESYVGAWSVLNGDQIPFDAERTAYTAARSYDRGVNRPGVARQILAITASGNRTPKLASVALPTLVIHGTNDPLVRPEAGHATAAAIPGAKLVLVEGMGHTLPRQAWPQIVDAIAEHARETAS
jgi:pimeloyl-ACP methyl ester carboxylesterase